MVTAAKISHFQPDRVAVDQLMGFFKLDLRRGSVAKLDGAVQRSLAFSLYDISTVVGFVYQNADFLLGDFYDASANGKVIKLAVRVAFFVADSNGAGNGNGYKRLMARKNSDLALFGRDHDLVGFLVDFFTKQRNKF